MQIKLKRIYCSIGNRNPEMEGCHYELVLVRDEGDEFDGVTNRSWAYEDEGKMPKEFDNGISVPKRFLAEYGRVWK